MPKFQVPVDMDFHFVKDVRISQRLVGDRDAGAVAAERNPLPALSSKPMPFTVAGMEFDSDLDFDEDSKVWEGELTGTVHIKGFMTEKADTAEEAAEMVEEAFWEDEIHTYFLPAGSRMRGWDFDGSSSGYEIGTPVPLKAAKAPALK